MGTVKKAFVLKGTTKGSADGFSYPYPKKDGTYETRYTTNRMFADIMQTKHDIRKVPARESSNA